MNPTRRRPLRSRVAAVWLCLLAGCATLPSDSVLDQRYGPADPARFDQPQAPVPGGVSYRTDVAPILQQRCVVCHGCYDAPCQIKLGAWEGIARGGSKLVVYDADRLSEAAPTRLFVDAQLPSQWRDKGFFPVLNERVPTPEANLAGSLLYRSLALKQQHPLPAQPVLGEAFDFSLGRANACPRVEQYDAFAAASPLAGMPYGLPELTVREMGVVTRWLEAGAPYEGELPLSALQHAQVRQWEAFLNGVSNKERLMSRYLFEHLFLGHLYFDADAAHRPFRLVRSSTPPGQAAQIIATRRPYDDPGVARFWYRLVPEREALVAKTHMPYALGPARMEKYRQWFLAAGFEVTSLPSFAIEVASNPFIAFRELPVDARYRFLLDEAQFFIMNFIKGPVCRGQMAVDVIEDQFWVFFVDPRLNRQSADGAALMQQAEATQLPASQGSDSRLLRPWLRLAEQERAYLKLKSRVLQQAVDSGEVRLDLGLVWDGDGHNRNAALTIFRHFDNASVVKGLVGAPPKTAWVIDYALFERIFYLLVAGYDVFGNVAHQLNSRLYMDFMRMEGEFNFLVLLPQQLRRPTARHWYRGASDEADEYVYGQYARLDSESAVAYRSGDAQAELYALLRRRLAPVLDARFDLDKVSDAALGAELQALARLRGASLSWLPEMSVLRVDAAGTAPRYIGLLRNTGHANVAHMAREKGELRPDENTLTVVPGFIGAYPNAIYRVDAAALPQFRAALAGLASEADYRRLADRFAVRRTDPAFWATSDALHAAYVEWAPLEAGLFDLNRFENR